MKKYLLAAASLSLSLFVLEEAALFWESRLHKDSWPFLVGNADWTRDAFIPSLSLGWEHRPNSVGFNSLGFPGPEYPLKKNPGTRRIILLGDSLAEAYGNDLRNFLTRISRSSNGIELWNLGVGGYALNQYASIFKEKGLRADPDAAIMFICLNDMNFRTPVVVPSNRGYLEVMHFNPTRGELRFPLAKQLWNVSALYRLAVLSRIRAQGLLIPKSEPEDRRKIAAQSLEEIKKLCREKNIPLTAFLFPYLLPERDYSPKQQDEYRTIKAVLHASGIRYFDLHGRFSDKLLGKRVVPEDDIHFSPQGRKEAMEIISALLGQDPVGGVSP